MGHSERASAGTHEPLGVHKGLSRDSKVYVLKYLQVKEYHVYNLLSSGSENSNMCTYM